MPFAFIHLTNMQFMYVPPMAPGFNIDEHRESLLVHVRACLVYMRTQKTHALALHDPPHPHADSANIFFTTRILMYISMQP